MVIDEEKKRAYFPFHGGDTFRRHLLNLLLTGLALASGWGFSLMAIVLTAAVVR